MPSRPLETSARQVEALFTGGSVAGLPDVALLDRFRAGDGPRAERAFEALVVRHGPLVRGICRRIVRDPSDADDAFQATFLVLVRRAGSVRVEDSLGRWLAGVARRVAARVRADRERRLRRERAGGAIERAAPEPDLPSAEVLGALDAEVARLAEPFRAAVVLCDLGGRTHEQAALDLGCPVGTVKSRLARGRARLKARLTRRGFDGPLGLALVGPAGVSPRLVDSTVRLALAAAGPTLGAGSLKLIGYLTLKDGVARMMLAAPTQWVAGTALALAMAATGWTWMADRPDRDQSPPTQASDPRPDTEGNKTIHAGDMSRESNSSIRSKELARQVFGPDSWMAQDIKLRHHDASRGSDLYAGDYQLLDGSRRIEVKPFAMIFSSKDGTRHQTITSDRASVDLDQPYGLLKKQADPVRVVHVDLSGNVRVGGDGGSSVDHADDMPLGSVARLDFDGGTVRVAFAGKVEFQRGGLRVNGSGLEIEFQLDSQDRDQPRHKPSSGENSSRKPGGGQSSPEPRTPPHPPREFSLTSMPEYVVQPPDMIRVEVLEALDGRPITGERLVLPDGTISLGYYGNVYAAGLTCSEIKEKVVLHLKEFLSEERLGLMVRRDGKPVAIDPGKSTRVFVEVLNFNSKVYYVLGDVGSPGRLPVTGGETVLDAITFAGGLIPTSSVPSIRLVRPAPPGTAAEQVLPVDYAAIVTKGDTATNYQIRPGDRVVVQRDAEVAAKFAEAAKAGNPDARVAEIERKLDLILQKLDAREAKP